MKTMRNIYASNKLNPCMSTSKSSCFETEGVSAIIFSPEIIVFKQTIDLNHHVLCDSNLDLCSLLGSLLTECDGVTIDQCSGVAFILIDLTLLFYPPQQHLFSKFSS